MAQQLQPPWKYSEVLGGYFVYEPSTDSIILRTGQRFLRPAHIDPATLTHAAYERGASLIGSGINDAQLGRQGDQVLRGRGRGRGRGQDRGRGRGRNRGRGRGQGRGRVGDQGFNPYQSDHRQAGHGQPHQTQSPNALTNELQVSQMPLGAQGIVADMNGMSLSSQASSSHSQALSQQQSLPGLTQGFDPDTQVKTLVQKSRPELVTPPELLAERIYSRQRLVGTQSGKSEKLDPSFKIQPQNFFTIGRVFKVLWAEPAGGNTTAITNKTFTNYLGERVHCKVRWFVVIREGDLYCGALPITTYGGRGVAKPGVIKAEHGIIYTGRNIPIPDRTELLTRPNEEGMRSEPIKVDPDSPLDRMDPKSRINFAAVSTVHHNIKVKSMGNVHQDCIRILRQHFHNVWSTPHTGPSSTQYLRNQQSPTTRTPVSGHDRASLNSMGNHSAGPPESVLATTTIGRHGRGQDEGSDDEADDEDADEDAEGGAESDSSDDGDDGNESDGNEA